MAVNYSSKKFYNIGPRTTTSNKKSFATSSLKSAPAEVVRRCVRRRCRRWRRCRSRTRRCSVDTRSSPRRCSITSSRCRSTKFVASSTSCPVSPSSTSRRRPRRDYATTSTSSSGNRFRRRKRFSNGWASSEPLPSSKTCRRGRRLKRRIKRR
jgi:hypothetical protein